MAYSKIKSIAAVAALVLVSGCAYVPGYGLYVPHSEEWRREVEGKGSAAVKSQGRSAESLSGSAALVYAELNHHLPPPVVQDNNAQRLTVKKRGGLIFGGGTYEVEAVGDFTPERVEKFIAAARRLQNHLESSPHFILQLLRDAADGTPVPVATIEID